MQKTIIAALVVTLASGMLTVLLRKVGLLIGDAAQTAVGLFAAGLALVDYMDRKWSRTVSCPMSLDDFTLPGMRIFSRTFLVIFAARQLMGVIGVGLGFVAFGTNPPPDRHFIPLVALLGLIMVAIVFTLGTWAGSRAKEHSYRVAALASLLAVTLGVTLDFVVVPVALFTRLFIVGKTVDHYVFKILLGWLMYLIPLLIGVRRGCQKRVTIYLRGLCGGLPMETQLVVASLVHGELKRRPEPATAPYSEPAARSPQG